MSRRERAKRERRERILDAAEALIRAAGDVSFSMRALADRSGLSLATPFNLFGSKAEVLIALLERSLDAQFERLAATSQLEPIERVFSLGERGTRAYTADASLYRPLLRALVETRLDGPVPHLMEQATRLWREALRDAETQGQLDPAFDLDAFARLLHYQYRVTMLNWASREIGAREWLAEMEYATAVLLHGAVDDALRPRLLARIRAAQQALAAARGAADADDEAASLPTPARRRSS